MHFRMIQRAVVVALGALAALILRQAARLSRSRRCSSFSMENHNLTQPNPLSSPQQIRGNVAAPFLNSLMTPGNPNALHTSFRAELSECRDGVHPSAPNYIWSQGGSKLRGFERQ